MGQVDSVPGWGAARAKALGQEQGQQADQQGSVDREQLGEGEEPKIGPKSRQWEG